MIDCIGIFKTSNDLPHRLSFLSACNILGKLFPSSLNFKSYLRSILRGSHRLEGCEFLYLILALEIEVENIFSFVFSCCAPYLRDQYLTAVQHQYMITWFRTRAHLKCIL